MTTTVMEPLARLSAYHPSMEGKRVTSTEISRNFPSQGPDLLLLAKVATTQVTLTGDLTRLQFAKVWRLIDIVVMIWMSRAAGPKIWAKPFLAGKDITGLADMHLHICTLFMSSALPIM